MHRALFTLFLAAVAAGCSSSRLSRVAVTALPPQVSAPPFSTGARLTKQQLDWYVQRAVAWMQTDRDQLPDSSYIRRVGFMYGSTIDSTRPIECVQSDDCGTVTVTIPQRIEQHSEYWLVVHLDVHTGAVTSHGALMVSKNV